MFALGRPSITSVGLLKSSLKPSTSRYISLKPDFSKFKKIEQPAGFIVGTVNEPYRIPLVSFYDGGFHWSYERMIAIGMIPLAMTPFIAGVEHPMIDSVFSVLLLFHCHAGFKSCIIDYIPQRVYNAWHGVASKLLTLGTFICMYGVYVLETSSNGLFDLMKGLWMS